MELARIIKQMMNGIGSNEPNKISRASPEEKETFAMGPSLKIATLRLAKLVAWEYHVAENSLRYTPDILDWLFVSNRGQDSWEEFCKGANPTHKENMRKKIALAISTGASFETEFKKQTPQGKEKWVLVRCMTEQKNGQVCKLLGTAQDITLEKKKEMHRVKQQLLLPYQLLQRAFWEHENELGRIAVAVHEDISQVLIVARNYLQTDCREQAPIESKQERGIKIVEKAIVQLRELYEQIDIPPLLLLGLEGALTELIDRYNRQTPTQLVMTAFDTAIEECEELIKITLIRLVKELLNNVRIHSRAIEAWVSLELINKDILLTVKDDGIGFYPDKEQWRTGLRRIEIMSSMLGGTVEVIASPGKGCDVLITLPYATRPTGLE